MSNLIDEARRRANSVTEVTDSPLADQSKFRQMARQIMLGVNGRLSGLWRPCYDSRGSSLPRWKHAMHSR